MKLSYHHLIIPMKSPFITSFGSSSNKDVLVFQANEGNITAFSESVTNENPFYGPEDNYTALYMIKSYLADKIRDLPLPEEFNERARQIKGNNMAKAAMEMLLYDFHAKKEGASLVKYFKKEIRGYANAGVSLGIDDPNITLKKIDDAIQRGYKRLKVKIKKGYDLELLSKIRDTFPEIPLSVDANSDYTKNDFQTIKSMDRYELEYIEQPLYHDDLYYHAQLAKLIETPLCLDESITSPELAQNAIDMGACSIINIKPGRVGGLDSSLKIAEIARNNNAHCWVGGMLETGIGRAFNISLASLNQVDFPGDTSPNDRYFEHDIVNKTFSMENGTIKPMDGPGIGVKIDPGTVKKFTVGEGVIFE
ncbi:MAG: o-succinylbenzoate synthase [Candidatus Thermoplasmatota archaeon]|nr:o-succinylbenzoate synthase [Candidatus Thermoplasmatota archaeon]MCL5889511.1 o-succinylbenzoate synthase [Candidatus Thermoplasmatota archaeon]